VSKDERIAELTRALKDIATDCEGVMYDDSITPAERRAWKAVAVRASVALRRASGEPRNDR
jgi:hypothetical protein